MAATAEALDRCANVLALGGRDFFESLDRYAGLLGEGHAAAAVGAPSLKATFHEGPVSFSSVSAWVGQHALGQNGEAARRGVGGDLRVRLEEPLAGEQIGDTAAEFGFSGRRSCGREFLRGRVQKGSWTLDSFSKDHRLAL